MLYKSTFHLLTYLPTHIHGLAVFAECLAAGLACGDQRRLTGSGSALEALRDAIFLLNFRLSFGLSLWSQQKTKPESEMLHCNNRYYTIRVTTTTNNVDKR